jgi:hypothetical protein
MEDNDLVKYIWNILVLKQRFERDPYSLTHEDIEILEYYDDYLAEK